jgi:hypothetical protein
MLLSVRNAGRAAATRFICKRPYRWTVEPDGSVGSVGKRTGSPRLPRGEAKLIMLKDERPNSSPTRAKATTFPKR